MYIYIYIYVRWQLTECYGEWTVTMHNVKRQHAICSVYNLSKKQQTIIPRNEQLGIICAQHMSQVIELEIMIAKLITRRLESRAFTLTSNDRPITPAASNSKKRTMNTCAQYHTKFTHLNQKLQVYQWTHWTQIMILNTPKLVAEMPNVRSCPRQHLAITCKPGETILRLTGGSSGNSCIHPRDLLGHLNRDEEEEEVCTFWHKSTSSAQLHKTDDKQLKVKKTYKTKVVHQREVAGNYEMQWSEWNTRLRSCQS